MVPMRPEWLQEPFFVESCRLGGEVIVALMHEETARKSLLIRRLSGKEGFLIMSLPESPEQEAERTKLFEQMLQADQGQRAPAQLFPEELKSPSPLPETPTPSLKECWTDEIGSCCIETAIRTTGVDRAVMTTIMAQDEIESFWLNEDSGPFIRVASMKRWFTERLQEAAAEDREKTQ